MTRSLCVACVLFMIAPTAQAQEESAARSADVERMIREGMLEALDARYRGGSTADEWHDLAQAATNKARRTREADARRRAYRQAAQHYQSWLRALEQGGRRENLAGTVRLAAARVEYGGLLLSGPAAAELDEFELTAGLGGDRGVLREILSEARKQYLAAESEVAPLIRELPSYEEELLAAGLYDLLLQTRLDVLLNLGWTHYYLGRITTDAAQQRELFEAARRGFQDLLDTGQAGPTRAACHLAIGMAQRELANHDQAAESMNAALRAEPQPVIEAQIRYELARNQMAAGQFNESRVTLRPLLEKDPERLNPADVPLRFYVNLAHVWEAYSYLLEAERIRAQARESVAQAAIIQKAQRQRETGLARFKLLARRGGPWPALVQLYIAAQVNVRTPVEQLSPIELLYTAGVLMDAKKHDSALERLKAAAARGMDDPMLAGEVLFELARCHYLLRDERTAAETFQLLAREHRNHEKAPQAASFAYALWARLAEQSGAQADYVKLVEAVRNLIENYADHPKRVEAMWVLPVALQLAGACQQAADEFAKVPSSSPHWEEAQFRKVLCARRALDAARASLSSDEFKRRAETVALELVRYADDALGRSKGLHANAELAKWSAEARVVAAELLVTRGVEAYDRALRAAAEFEAQYPESDLKGRVLAVRIRAHRGRQEFAQASQILAQYLEAAPPEQVGATLAGLASGMRAEVERLADDGAAAAAHDLAADAIPTFEELEKWIRADASRSAGLSDVLGGLARMQYLAAQYESAQQTVTKLLAREPRNGNYQHLRALILTAQLADDAPASSLEDTRSAWATLLQDATVRKRAPDRYWEARYHWLRLTLKLGQANEVQEAIFQESRWFPDLGGPPWKQRLSELYLQAGGTRSLTPESGAETRPTF